MSKSTDQKRSWRRTTSTANVTIQIAIAPASACDAGGASPMRALTRAKVPARSSVATSTGRIVPPRPREPAHRARETHQ